MKFMATSLSKLVDNLMKGNLIQNLFDNLIH